MTPLRPPVVQPEDWTIVLIVATGIAAFVLALQAALG